MCLNTHICLYEEVFLIHLYNFSQRIVVFSSDDGKAQLHKKLVS